MKEDQNTDGASISFKKKKSNLTSPHNGTLGYLSDDQKKGFSQIWCIKQTLDNASSVDSQQFSSYFANLGSSVTKQMCLKIATSSVSNFRRASVNLQRRITICKIKTSQFF